MATTLTADDLRHLAEVYLSEWSVMTVKDEVLTPVGVEGQVFLSFWDNWVIPPDVNGIDPIITKDGFALQEGADYTFLQVGDSLRTKIQLTNAEGVDAIIMATYRRSLFRNSFWESTLRQATSSIFSRLLMTPPLWANGLNLDADNDPWPIIIKQAGKNALVNLQTFLAGLGKTQVEGVLMDMSRAHSMVHEVIDDLEGDIDRDVVAWRWKRSPVGRAASMTPMPGPGPLWGGTY
jgi:hypothetical protein